MTPSSVRAVTSSSGELGDRHEGVIAGRPEGRRQAFKDASPLMKNLVALAVHRDGGPDGGAPKDLVQGLVSQAHPQDGDLPIKMGDDCLADARLIRGLGARRDAEPVRLKRRDAGQIDLVVAKDQDLQIELVEELHQVIGKGVVVVDHHQAHQPPSRMKIPEEADRRVRPLRAHTQVRPYRTQ